MTEPEFTTKEAKAYCDGFDACVVIVNNMLDNYDSNELAKYSVWDFIDKFKENLLAVVETTKRNKR